MASKSKSLKLSPDLSDALDLIAKANGYHSGAALMKGMGRYAILTNCKHLVSLAWSLMPLEDQDKLDAVLKWRAEKKLGMTAVQALKWDWRVDWAKMQKEAVDASHSLR